MNKITKLLLVLFLLSISLESIAQKKEKAPFTPGHEVRIGIGMLPLNASMSSFDYLKYDSPSYSPMYSNHNFNQALYNAGPRFITGAISIGYSYNIFSWLSAGATFSYHGDYQKIYSRITDESIGKNNIHQFALTPMVRFNYLNTPMVRLYSQLGLGIGLEKINSQNEKKSSTSNYFYASGQITFLGISVGRKLYGFTELLGFGSQGFCVTGIGYKF